MQHRDEHQMTDLRVTLVTGPPCSGKTTYVAQHRQPGDIVLDYDAIAQALGSGDTHDHPKSIHPYALHVIDAVLDRHARDVRHTKLWLIKCDPAKRDIALAGSRVTLNATAEGCKRRATEAGRPKRWLALIDAWFERHSVA